MNIGHVRRRVARNKQSDGRNFVERKTLAINEQFIELRAVSRKFGSECFDDRTRFFVPANALNLRERLREIPIAV